MNRVELVGNVGSDKFENLQLKQWPDGGLAINFTMGTHYMTTVPGNPNKIKQTEWHSLCARGEVAKRIAQEVQKGTYLWVEGFLRTRTYLDSNQVKHKITEVVVRRFVVAAKRDTANAYVAPNTTTGNAPVLVDPNTLTPKTVVQPGPTQQIVIPEGHTLARNADGSFTFIPIKAASVLGPGNEEMTTDQSF